MKQVRDDQALICERVGRLTGAKGLARLEAALTAARAAASEEEAMLESLPGQASAGQAVMLRGAGNVALDTSSPPRTAHSSR